MGLGRVEQAKKRADEKRGNRKFLTIEDGETVIVRFLEEGEDFRDAYVHRTPFENDKGKTYYSDIACLDQEEKGKPCPGCKDDLERRYKFYANVIVRDYPEVNDKGKVIDEKDQLMIWAGGIKAADKLAKKHKKYGLMSRDWEITRDGVEKKTTYDIELADEGATELSKEDRKLMEKKHDLTFYIKPPSAELFYTPPSERGKAERGEDGGSGSKKANPWAERKKSQTKTRMRTKSRRRSGGDEEKQSRSSGTKKKSTSTTRVRRRSRR